MDSLQLNIGGEFFDFGFGLFLFASSIKYSFNDFYFLTSSFFTVKRNNLCRLAIASSVVCM